MGAIFLRFAVALMIRCLWPSGSKARLSAPRPMCPMPLPNAPPWVLLLGISFARAFPTRRGGGFLFFWFSSVFFGFLLVFFWFSSGFLPVFLKFQT